MDRRAHELARKLSAAMLARNPLAVACNGSVVTG
jgi:hypothetical protein